MEIPNRVEVAIRFLDMCQFKDSDYKATQREECVKDTALNVLNYYMLGEHNYKDEEIIEERNDATITLEQGEHEAEEVRVSNG